MEVIQEENITEHFSLTEIKWKIKNISLAICPLEKSICSDEFQIAGLIDTLWRLSLKISHEHDRVTMYLKMLEPNHEFSRPDGKKSGLRVNWKCNLLDLIGEEASSSEYAYLFNYRDNIAVETFALTDVLNYLPHFAPDELEIKCHMLIDFDKVPKFDMSTLPEGLVELSNALVKIPTEPLYPDITIAVGKSLLHLHKDMFFNVRGMVKLIQKQNSKTITLLNHDFFSLECIFRYAYSGNLHFILSVPRIILAEEIQLMDIPELKGAYAKEKIELKTELVATKLEKEWRIENFELVEESLDGPEINEVGSDCIWQIRMHPNGKVDGNPQEKKYVFLEAALLWCKPETIDVNVDFCCLNVENKIIYCRREHKRLNVDEKIEVPFFLKGGTLMRKCLIGKDLNLLITVSVSTDSATLGMGDVIDRVPFELNNAITLNLFSRKMAFVLSNPLFPDVLFLSGSFASRVHKFVLGSRSPYLKARLPPQHGAALTVEDYPKHFIRIFIENLYTGLFSDLEFPTNCHMYHFGFKFDVKHLKDRCQREMTPETVLEIVEYADNNNLKKLKLAAYKLISEMGEGITDHYEWHEFLCRKTALALDVLNYLGVDNVAFG